MQEDGTLNSALLALAKLASPEQKTRRSAAEIDPSEWSDDFGRWALERCVYRPDRGDCGGLNTLHSDFCDWCITNDEVPCSREVFKALLLDEGFQITSHREIEMVPGLILRADLWALKPRGE